MKKIIFPVLLITSQLLYSQTYLPIGSNGVSVEYSNLNLNNLTSVGFYKGNSMTNAPDAGWWYVTVEAHDNTGGNQPGWTKQTVTAYGAGNSYPVGTTFIRNQTGGISWTSWKQIIILNENGNVGIGTTNPIYKLSVYDSQFNLGYFKRANGGGGAGFTLENGSSIAINFGIGANAIQNFFAGLNGGSDNFLYVQGGTNGFFNLKSDAKMGWVTSPTDATSFSPDTYFYRNSANNIRTPGSLLIDNNVCIGTIDPKGYKLAVNGSAIFTKAVVKQNANWPDYVFANDYDLYPLTLVEQFIKVNKHLPEVPTAKEIEKNGLDIGNNQTLLLKKIEELTLYLIEQNRSINDLKKENEQLKKNNEELKTQLEKQNNELLSRIEKLEKAANR